MKKLISLILVMAISFSLISVSAFAKDNIAEFELSIGVREEKEHGAQLETKWYYNSTDGRYYLFIPNSINLDSANLYFDSANTVTIDGTAITSGSSAAVLSEKTEFVLNCNGENIDLRIINESKVASVFIETESGSLDAVHEDKSHKEKGEITIISSDGDIECDGELDYIKGRGNSTWGMPKKPYNIKLEDKENLFGMGKSKKWSLIANYADKTLLRNALAYEAAERAGFAYTPKYEPVDVYINGDYMGSYLLTTRVEVDKTRVNIDNLEDLNEEANEGVDIEALPRGGVYGSVSGYLEGSKKWVEIPNNPENITGGYILELELPSRYDEEISGFVTKNSQTVVFKSPEYASEAQVEYMSGYYQNFEAAVYENKGLEAVSEYCNVDSLVNSYLFNEWVTNHDACQTSTYFYKPANDTLYAGPVWDFDRAFGNCDVIRFGLDYNKPSQWTVCHSTLYGISLMGRGDISDKPTFLNLLAKNQDFLNLCKQKWKSGLFETFNESAEYIFSDYAELIEGTTVADAIRWNLYGTADVLQIKANIKKEIKKAEDFEKAKTEFITQNIGTVAERKIEKSFFDDLLDRINIFGGNVLEKLVTIFRLENIV